jgi:hypothetical protein
LFSQSNYRRYIYSRHLSWQNEDKLFTNVLRIFKSVKDSMTNQIELLNQLEGQMFLLFNLPYENKQKSYNVTKTWLNKTGSWSKKKAKKNYFQSRIWIFYCKRPLLLLYCYYYFFASGYKLRETARSLLQIF